MVLYMQCPYCGSIEIVNDKGMFVCTSCATVIDYEAVPAIRDLMEIRDREITRIDFDREIAKRIAEQLAGKKIIGFGRKRADIYRYIAALYSKDINAVSETSWKIYRRAVEIMRSSGLDISKAYDDYRVQMVRNQINKIGARLGISDKDIDKIYELAIRNRDLWSGRKSDVIASVFTIIYCEKHGMKSCFEKADEIMSRRAKRLAHALKTVVKKRLSKALPS
jgi:transcription initiation factor TFIIIB Brf1 subunit/transcription initiation factor TFIIB